MKGWRGKIDIDQCMHFLLFLSATILGIFSLASCAGMLGRDMDAILILEMEKNCNKVEVKRDYQGTVYVITYTGKTSKDKCPVAAIRAWKNDTLIEEKEVGICGCREGK